MCFFRRRRTGVRTATLKVQRASHETPCHHARRRRRMHMAGVRDVARRSRRQQRPMNCPTRWTYAASLSLVCGVADAAIVRADMIGFRALRDADGAALPCRDDLLMGDDGGVQFWQQYQQWEEEENERLSGNQCGSKALTKTGPKDRTAQQGRLSNLRNRRRSQRTGSVVAANGLCIANGCCRVATSARARCRQGAVCVTVEAKSIS